MNPLEQLNVTEQQFADCYGFAVALFAPMLAVAIVGFASGYGQGWLAGKQSEMRQENGLTWGQMTRAEQRDVLRRQSRTCIHRLARWLRRR